MKLKMNIDYDFVPEYKANEIRTKTMINSYAGKLLEVCESRSVLVYLDNMDKPVVLATSSYLTDPTDFICETY